MSILRKFLSSISHLIVKLGCNFHRESMGHCTCSDMLSRCYKAFYISFNLPGVILLQDKRALITASNLKLPLTVNKSSNNVFEMFFYLFYIDYSIVCLDSAFLTFLTD